MILNRIARKVAEFHGKRLPSGIVKVAKGESGERIIEGVRAFVDSFPDIPFGKRTQRGDWVSFSRAEREVMHLEAKAKAERAAKRALKPAKPRTVKIKMDRNGNPIVPRPPTPERSFSEAMVHIADSQIGTVEAKSFPDMPVEYRTVLRGGKWVQVGSDNLSAFIEAR